MTHTLRFRSARRAARLVATAVASACSSVDQPDPPVVATVAVIPDSHSLVVGEELALTARAFDANGNVISGRSTSWSSSDAAVATVSATGRVVAVAPGAATVRAKIDEQIGSMQLTVSAQPPAPVASIAISPTVVVLEVGEMRALTATVRDAQGNVLTDRPVTWSVDGTALRIAESGVVTGLKPGYATVTATSGGKSISIGATTAAGEASDFDLVYARRSAPDVSEIFVMTIGAGAAPTRVNAGTVSSQPTASPDGLRVAFAVSQFDAATQQMIEDIYAVDRNGMNIERLTTAPGLDDQPAWSPDGSRIAYRHSDPNGRTDVWVMARDGSGAVNLTADMPAQQVTPAWSPDGNRIAFVAVTPDDAGAAYAIWTMRADGTDKRLVTSSSDGPLTHPTYSADGQHLAFTRAYGNEIDIAIIDTGGGASTRIPLVGRQVAPAWSPDGRYIAFLQGGPVMNLYTIAADGSQLRLRTLDEAWASAYDPAWIRRQ